MKAALGICAAICLIPRPAEASLTVLIGEPFGSFGAMMPVGHTAVYLDHVCADGPLKLRSCQPGEQEGVVIARYHRVGGLDWLASPVMQFLYATDRPEDVPEFVTPELAWSMRQQYRRRFLESIVPDGAEKDKATDEWWESAGVAFNRKLWGYKIETTREQDLAFIARMNQDANHHRYHLNKTNCANFAADVVNAYFPGTVHQDKVADFGWMTPKQVARSVSAYGKAHPEAALQVIEVPQIPGTLIRSRPVRGAAETVLKSKRYLATLMIIQPEIPIGSALLYMNHGRWEIGKGSEPVGPNEFSQTLAMDAAPPVSPGKGNQGSTSQPLPTPYADGVDSFLEEHLEH